jgi:hypothetical protein
MGTGRRLVLVVDGTRRCRGGGHSAWDRARRAGAGAEPAREARARGRATGPVFIVRDLLEQCGSGRSRIGSSGDVRPTRSERSPGDRPDVVDPMFHVNPGTADRPPPFGCVRNRVQDTRIRPSRSYAPEAAALPGRSCRVLLPGNRMDRAYLPRRSWIGRPNPRPMYRRPKDESRPASQPRSRSLPRGALFTRMIRAFRDAVALLSVSGVGAPVLGCFT